MIIRSPGDEPEQRGLPVTSHSGAYENIVARNGLNLIFSDGDVNSKAKKFIGTKIGGK
jgi:hypothetical protein